MLVYIDVKGAFNTVKKDFIYKILRDKGVPNNIVRLVVDFISNRTVYPRRGRVKGSSILLDNGFP
jgi:phosphoribosylaminoimidazole-succinocarboxamide synthase